MAKKVSIVSLGCPKNLVDSESILGRLIAQGWEFDPSVEGADLVVLNTCGFIESARQEATETLESLLKLKRRKKIGAIAVCGCLIRALGNELPRRYPEVDAWYGPFDESRLSETFPLGPLVPPKPERAEPARKPVPFRDTVRRRYTFRDENRLLLTLPHTAYLKIAEGCDRFCSYCAIPAIRGRFTSKPLEAVLSEAEILARSGVKELVLIAQETTFWGNDLYGEPRLAKLLTELKGMNAFPWIRLLYTYPLFFGDELLELFGGGDGDASAVLPYVDLPLQHCNDAILKRMNRRVGKSETEDLLARLRETIPGLTLRTTFITGFPGETDAAFEELLEFAEKWRFERAGVFAYSAEAGTRAAELEGQIPDEVKEERRARLYEVLTRVSAEQARAKVGKSYKVLVDTPVVDDGGEVEDFYVGRTAADAPDIDPVVYLTGSGLTPGEFCRAEIVDTQQQDLIAAVL
ncbi:MAG: 30S ribosomal protein S12 methylthiotransferase RimO [Thermoguttaceae bacterium]|nr:30S ribosomal protein S12 methylthiotransferase RimO [Thermoguttaceae bacterium]